jgi:hypothetical protein
MVRDPAVVLSTEELDSLREVSKGDAQGVTSSLVLPYRLPLALHAFCAGFPQRYLRFRTVAPVHLGDLRQGSDISSTPAWAPLEPT